VTEVGPGSASRRHARRSGCPGRPTTDGGGPRTPRRGVDRLPARSATPSPRLFSPCCTSRSSWISRRTAPHLSYSPGGPTSCGVGTSRSSGVRRSEPTSTWT
jgi:hypothetical protein